MVLILIFPEIPRVLVLMKNRKSESLSISTIMLIKMSVILGLYFSQNTVVTKMWWLGAYNLYATAKNKNFPLLTFFFPATYYRPTVGPTGNREVYSPLS